MFRQRATARVRRAPKCWCSEIFASCVLLLRLTQRALERGLCQECFCSAYSVQHVLHITPPPPYAVYPAQVRYPSSHVQCLPHIMRHWKIFDKEIQRWSISREICTLSLNLQSPQHVLVSYVLICSVFLFNRLLLQLGHRPSFQFHDLPVPIPPCIIVCIYNFKR